VVVLITQVQLNVNQVLHVSLLMNSFHNVFKHIHIYKTTNIIIFIPKFFIINILIGINNK